MSTNRINDLWFNQITTTEAGYLSRGVPPESRLNVSTGNEHFKLPFFTPGQLGSIPPDRNHGSQGKYRSWRLSSEFTITSGSMSPQPRERWELNLSMLLRVATGNCAFLSISNKAVQTNHQVPEHLNIPGMSHSDVKRCNKCMLTHTACMRTWIRETAFLASRKTMTTQMTRSLERQSSQPWVFHVRSCKYRSLISRASP